MAYVPYLGPFLDLSAITHNNFQIKHTSTCVSNDDMANVNAKMDGVGLRTNKGHRVRIEVVYWLVVSTPLKKQPNIREMTNVKNHQLVAFGCIWCFANLLELSRG